ncbi:hypothetical protein VNI00_014799 [Paramarasmius palmivorus]|uniref:Uncharacterized protein n=1 Tax=Paramarasmius palmivorus TaxID=297713 RepID=A0AAW0BQN6_9AGAR
MEDHKSVKELEGGDIIPSVPKLDPILRLYLSLTPTIGIKMLDLSLYYILLTARKKESYKYHLFANILLFVVATASLILNTVVDISMACSTYVSESWFEMNTDDGKIGVWSLFGIQELNSSYKPQATNFGSPLG